MATNENSKTFPPAISHSHARELERTCTSVVLARQRRAVWLACTADSARLDAIREGGPKNFAEIVAAADVFRRHAEEIARLAAAACERLDLVAK